MLVGGAGQVKLTKDGNVLLSEMQIQHPTATMIARSSTAQDDIVGDGTTSNVLLIGELLRRAEQCVALGLHPQFIAEGFEVARNYCVGLLEEYKLTKEIDRELLLSVARTSLRTKLHADMANQLTEIVTDAVLNIKKPEQPVDLFMVEIMHMTHKMATETQLVKGLVLDHGSRHPDMPTRLNNCFILTCNVSLEYERTEVNAGFFYKTAEQRDALQSSERKFTDQKVQKIIDLKRAVCEGTDKTFVILNQKGIDPPSLDALAVEGIIALRRAKRRNMERLTLACGGNAVNSVDELTPEDLGYADTVYEQVLGEEKYTFVEGVPHPFSCTILIKGPNEHTIAQLKDAVRDGLRAVSNTIQDNCVLPGAGAFEIACSCRLKEHAKSIEGKVRLGVEAFGESLEVIPRVLAENSGHDPQESLLKLISTFEKTGTAVGFDCDTGEPMNPDAEAIYDNLCVKQHFLQLPPVLASQLLLVDEVMRAGKQMGNDLMKG